MKSVASIPDNYVSILQLQERWMKEKEGKYNETDLGVKQQQRVRQRRREEEEPRVKKLEGKSLGGTVHVNPREKEPNCVEKEETEVSAVVSKEEKEDGEYLKERKKKWSKKKNQGGSVKEVGSKAYAPKEIPGENTVQNRENAAASAVETQFQHLQIKKRVEEDRQVHGPARLNRGHYRNQNHEARTMVWVKKGEK
ncbi:hypothetical protein Bca4012_038436 [Brassica carinata]